MSLESLVKEVQQSTLFFVQTKIVLLTYLTVDVDVAVGPFTTSEAIPSDVLYPPTPENHFTLLYVSHLTPSL